MGNTVTYIMRHAMQCVPCKKYRVLHHIGVAFAETGEARMTLAGERALLADYYAGRVDSFGRTVGIQAGATMIEPSGHGAASLRVPRLHRSDDTGAFSSHTSLYLYSWTHIFVT